MLVCRGCAFFFFLNWALGVFSIKCSIHVVLLITSLPPFLPLLSLSFVQNYVPTVFENYTASFEIDTQRIELSLWDTSGKTRNTAWFSGPVRRGAQDLVPCTLTWPLEGLPGPEPQENAILSEQGWRWG